MEKIGSESTAHGNGRGCRAAKGAFMMDKTDSQNYCIRGGNGAHRGAPLNSRPLYIYVVTHWLAG